MPSFPQVTTDHAWLNHPDDTAGIYNCWDTVATARVAKALQRELVHHNMLEFFQREVWPTVPVVLAMQRRGLPVSRTARRKCRAQIRDELLETEKEIHQFTSDHKWSEFLEARKAGKSLWLNSPQAKARFLYDELQLKVPPPTKDRPLRSSGQPALMWILRNLRVKDQPAVRPLHLLFHRSRLNTIYTRYLTFDLDPDDRVRPRIKMYGTETGRLAYADPALQQFPKEIRWFIQARPGFVFIARDYKQFEARILSYVSGDPRDIGVYESDGDIHRETAKDLFAKPTPTGPERNYAKAFRFKMERGGKADSDKEKLFCPCPKCEANAPKLASLTSTEKQQAEGRFWDKHTELQAWRDSLVKKVRFTHTHTTPLGRKRLYTQPFPGVIPELYGSIPQSCAADIINRAMRRVHKLDAPLVLQMHDELMLEVPEGEVNSWDGRLQEAMEAPVPELGGVVFPTDCSIGTEWGRLEDQ